MYLKIKSSLNKHIQPRNIPECSPSRIYIMCSISNEYFEPLIKTHIKKPSAWKKVASNHFFVPQKRSDQKKEAALFVKPSDRETGCHPSLLAKRRKA